MANEHIGALREIAFSVESSRGTATTPSSGDWIPHTGQGFKPVAEKVVDNSGMGVIAGRNRADISKEYAQGTIGMRLYDNFLTTVNTLMMGAAGTTVGDVTTYTLANNNSHKSFTITTTDPVAGDEKYAMGMLNSITLAATTDEYVTLSLDMIAKKAASATVTPGYSTTALPFSPDEITIAYADDFAGLSSPTTISAKNINLTVEKNVELDWVVGDTEPADIHNQRFLISGDLTLMFDTTTYREFALADTTKAIVITMTNSNWKWEIKLPSVDFSDFDVSTDLDGYVTQTFGIFADYTDQTNGFVQTVVTDVSA